MISSSAMRISRIAHTISTHRLFQPGDTLVVGLSGGADSLALLDLLFKLPGYNLHLVAAHLNHCLRGAEADADEEFCRETASRYGIPFVTRRIDVKKLAEERQQNLEDAGRHARIDFFDEISSAYGATAVALAHHADDQAETVLMRLLRGSGMTGLSGMAYRNSRGYIRPLLEIGRNDIEEYLRSCGLTWREDASNRDTTYLRNRIRHQLLPLLEEYNPAIRACLTATATIIRGDEELLNALTEQAYSDSCRVGKGGEFCSVAQLRSFDVALRRRVLRHGFKQLTGTLEGLSLRHIDAVSDLINSDRPNAQVTVPHGVVAVREYDRLKWMYAGDAEPDTAYELLISEPGLYPLPGGGSLSITWSPVTDFPTNSVSICCDPAVTPLPWLVRTFRPGDRITPFGMTGRKKVKDVFIDKKIPSSERSRIPLLMCGTDLLWIAGVCSSELCRCDSSHAALLHVVWHAPV